MSLQAFVIGSAILGGLYWDKKRRENIVTDNITAGRRKFVTDPYGEKIIVELGHGKTGDEWNYYYDKQWFPISAYGDGNWKIVGSKMVNSGYSSHSDFKRNPKKVRLKNKTRKFKITNLNFVNDAWYNVWCSEHAAVPENRINNRTVTVKEFDYRSIKDELLAAIQGKYGLYVESFDYSEV